MSFPKYPAYKDSGVEWIGEIPVGWNMVQLKRIISVVYGDNLKNEDRAEDGSVPVYGSNGVVGFHNISNAPSPTIMIGRKGSCGALNWSQIPAFAIDTVFFVELSSLINMRWVYWFLHILNLASLSQDTGVPGLSRETLYSQLVTFPSLPEQQAIASFLDRECGKIDALIAKQERLIALLAEKRQAVISHAVTKGLNPNAPMKESGIPWIGMVPEGWKVRPLKNVASVQTGIAKGKDVSEEKSVKIPYLRVANVQDGYLDLSELTMIYIDSDQVERYLLQKGDVLMNEGGDFDKLGRGAIWHGEIAPCVHQNHVFAVRPKVIISEWLSAVIRSDYAKFYFMTRAKQSTNLASISSTNLMTLPTIVPPPEEQKLIVKFLKIEQGKFENMITAAKTTITLLKERRSALISAAVTGKIDVRNQNKAIAA
ncbi:restriction endonuclease subunit S [Komagataeibacter swingsii]|uniref:Type I restriction endonuclease subunit S n=1 Tax=Komagataeibacter swingsii TaxID=215220 RepID=A0A2V4SCD7_9PROT|nr:restriction endonuclease subunit S [Komagataeibacter swingsii]PYD69608.1 type I restriction endonuclease subunit S [Komagataeibacter swingsii]GBQ54595.1 restriction endonuclease S subunit [Komagataeibacter swingsii DSM 16373]